MKDSRRLAQVITAIVVLAGIDLATKRWAVTALADGPIELPGPVDLRLGYNSGTAFGLFADAPTGVLSTITVALLIVLLITWRTDRAPTLPVILIVSGGLANAIDRIGDGRVVDTLHTGWWPTFNLADIFITIGVGLWILSTTTTKKHVDDQGAPLSAGHDPTPGLFGPDQGRPRSRASRRSIQNGVDEQ